MTKEELLAEVEDLLRTMPDRATIYYELDENFSWLGRVTAVLSAWEVITGGMVKVSIDQLHGVSTQGKKKALGNL